MNTSQVMSTIANNLTQVGLKVLGAIAVWVIGRWLIGLSVRLIQRALEKQHVDSTLMRYMGNIVTVMLAVRPYCHTDHYWQVYFDTNRLIREAFGEAGFPVPEQHFSFRGRAVAAQAS